MVVPMPRGDQLSRQWRLIQLISHPQGITGRSPAIVRYALPLEHVSDPEPL